MRKKYKVMVLVVIFVFVISGGIISVFYIKENGKEDVQKEITEYLNQYKPETTESTNVTGRSGLLPEQATTEAVERNSTVIVRGKVIDIGEPYKDEHGIVYHKVTVNISSVLKGLDKVVVGENVDFVVFGGEIDGKIFWAIDSPHFEKNEEVIVYLSQGTEIYYVTFEAYGKISIKNDSTAVGIDDAKGVFEVPVDDYEKEVRGFVE